MKTGKKQDAVGTSFSASRTLLANRTLTGTGRAEAGPYGLCGSPLRRGSPTATDALMDIADLFRQG